MRLACRVEERQVDGVRHRLVAGVVRMQPVVGMQVRPEPRRVLRVADRGGEVDHAVVGAAGTDPVVQRLPLRFPCLRPVEGAFEREQGAAVDGQPERVRPLNHCPVPGDEILDRRPRIVERHPDVVGRLQNHHVGHARLQQHVAVEPREAARTEERVRVRRRPGVRRGGQPGAAQKVGEPGVVAENPVAGDADVQHARCGVAVLGRQAAGQEVGPAAVRVDRRSGAVGDRIAHGHDGAGRSGRPDVDARQVEPLRRRDVDVEPLRAAPVTGRRQVAGRQRRGMNRRRRGRAPGVSGEIEVDRQIAERGDVERNRVAEHRRAGLDRDGRLTAEGQMGPCGDHGALAAARHVGRAHRERFGPEEIGQGYARLRPADARAHELPDGLIPQAHRRPRFRRRGRSRACLGRRRIQGQGARRPSADPAALGGGYGRRRGERDQEEGGGEPPRQDSGRSRHAPRSRAGSVRHRMQHRVTARLPPRTSSRPRPGRSPSGSASRSSLRGRRTRRPADRSSASARRPTRRARRTRDR